MSQKLKGNDETTAQLTRRSHVPRCTPYAPSPCVIGLHRARRRCTAAIAATSRSSSTAAGSRTPRSPTRVIQAYHTLLPMGRYPVAVIFVEIDPAEVDVNVHPTKAEVRFRESSAVFSAVQRAVRRTLIDQAPVPQRVRRQRPRTPRPVAGWTSPTRPARAVRRPSWSERRDALLAQRGSTGCFHRLG